MVRTALTLYIFAMCNVVCMAQEFNPIDFKKSFKRISAVEISVSLLGDKNKTTALFDGYKDATVHLNSEEHVILSTASFDLAGYFSVEDIPFHKFTFENSPSENRNKYDYQFLSDDQHTLVILSIITDYSSDKINKIVMYTGTHIGEKQPKKELIIEFKSFKID